MIMHTIIHMTMLFTKSHFVLKKDMDALKVSSHRVLRRLLCWRFMEKEKKKGLNLFYL